MVNSLPHIKSIMKDERLQHVQKMHHDMVLALKIKLFSHSKKSEACSLWLVYILQPWFSKGFFKESGNTFASVAMIVTFEIITVYHTK